MKTLTTLDGDIIRCEQIDSYKFSGMHLHTDEGIHLKSRLLFGDGEYCRFTLFSYEPESREVNEKFEAEVIESITEFLESTASNFDFRKITYAEDELL